MDERCFCGAGKRVNFSSPLGAGCQRSALEPEKDSNALSSHTAPFTALAGLCMAITSPPSRGGRQQLLPFQMLLIAIREEVRGCQGDAMNYLSWPQASAHDGTSGCPAPGPRLPAHQEDDW